MHVMERLEADVCVVGAGFAGMSAAWRLHQAGRKVIVLEARDRVGGRTWTVYLADGTQIDRGGAWFGPGQDRAYALAGEMGRTTYPTWSQGTQLLMQHGKPMPVAETALLRLNPLDLAEVAAAVDEVDAMAKQVNLDAPWNSRHAREWDQQTLAAWFEETIDPGLGRRVLETLSAEVFACSLAEISLLSALYLVHSNRGLQNLTAIRGGHQQDRVVGGTQSILTAIQERLGDAVRLQSPVRAIAWSPDHVQVTADGATVTARQAVVAVPQWLSQRIWWDPPLPRERAQLIQRVPVGQMYKIHLVYDTPFWREEGLSGQSLDPDALCSFTIDACGPTPPPGVLCALSAGPHAMALARLSPDERRATVVAAMTKRFGQKAAKVVDYIEQDWTAENWTGGAITTHYPPGVLTSFGPALRAPVGPLHWAGADHAPTMVGSIDAAIHSGERAAAEVLATAPAA
jgi:monoamine oxidase